LKKKIISAPAELKKFLLAISIAIDPAELNLFKVKIFEYVSPVADLPCTVGFGPSNFKISFNFE
jgi:hypothetical protein